MYATATEQGDWMATLGLLGAGLAVVAGAGLGPLATAAGVPAGAAGAVADGVACTGAGSGTTACAAATMGADSVAATDAGSSLSSRAADATVVREVAGSIVDELGTESWSRTDVAADGGGGDTVPIEL